MKKTQTTWTNGARIFLVFLLAVYIYSIFKVPEIFNWLGSLYSTYQPPIGLEPLRAKLASDITFIVLLLIILISSTKFKNKYIPIETQLITTRVLLRFTLYIAGTFALFIASGLLSSFIANNVTAEQVVKVEYILNKMTAILGTVFLAFFILNVIKRERQPNEASFPCHPTTKQRVSRLFWDAITIAFCLAILYQWFTN